MLYVNAEVNPLPWQEFRVRLLALYGPDMRAKATNARIRRVLDLFAEQGVQTTADLTVDVIAQFVASRPPELSPNTTATLLVTMRSVCEYAVRFGALRMNPFEIRRPSQWVRARPPTRKQQHHSWEDIVRVLEFARRDAEMKDLPWAQWRARRLYALVATVAMTGMRKMEALRLMVEDLRFDVGMIFITPRHRLKTVASAAPVPMASALTPILSDWLQYRLDGPYDLRPIDTGYIFPGVTRRCAWTGGPPGEKPLDRLVNLGVRAGIKGRLTFLSLRHSFATHGISKFGFSKEQVRAILRHTTERTQDWYVHPDVDNLRELGKRIDFVRLSPPEQPTQAPMP